MIVQFRGLSLYFADGTPPDVVKRAIDEAFGEVDRVERLERELGELRGALKASAERFEPLERAAERFLRTLYGDAEHRANRGYEVPDEGLFGVVYGMRTQGHEPLAAAARALEALERLEAAVDWRTAARMMAAALALDTGDESRSVAYDRAAKLYRAAGAEPPAVDREYTPDELEAIRTAPGPHDEDEAEFAGWARKAIRDLRNDVRKLRKARAEAEG